MTHAQPLKGLSRGEAHGGACQIIVDLLNSLHVKEPIQPYSAETHSERLQGYLGILRLGGRSIGVFVIQEEKRKQNRMVSIVLN